MSIYETKQKKNYNCSLNMKRDEIQYQTDIIVLNIESNRMDPWHNLRMKEYIIIIIVMKHKYLSNSFLT